MGQARHLAKVIRTIKGSRTILTSAQSSLKLFRAVKVANSTIELTSGVVNAGIKLFELENNNSANAISNVLMVLELASLGIDLSGGLKKVLTKNANEIVDNFSEVDGGLELLIKQGKISRTDKINFLSDMVRLSGRQDQMLVHIKNYKRQRIDLLNKFRNMSGGKGTLLRLFKTEIDLQPFPDIKSFYDDIILQYPVLKGSISETGKFVQPNIAVFETTLAKNGSQVTKVTDYANSNDIWPGNGWLKPFNDGDHLQVGFRKGVKDLELIGRRNDSELKYIYQFLSTYVDETDEFIITTKNIYLACTSCQRELLMLKDYVENTLGKKLSLKIISNQKIKNGEKFNELILKNGN